MKNLVHGCVLTFSKSGKGSLRERGVAADLQDFQTSLASAVSMAAVVWLLLYKALKYTESVLRLELVIEINKQENKQAKLTAFR